MHCPFCEANDTKVVDSRLSAEGDKVRRRRQCIICQGRFTTFEVAELEMPRIVKQDMRIEAYDPLKLRRGLELALEKRPIGIGAIDEIIDNIEHKLRRASEREIPARRLGEWVMIELKERDEVAYIRFASVYLSFQDVEAFKHIIDRLAQNEHLHANE